MRARVLAQFLSVFVALALLAGCGGSKPPEAPKQAAPAPAAGGQQQPAAPPAAAKPPIKLGAIFDLTGGTADVGVPHADGVRAYIDYINSKGGVNGRKIELTHTDYGYGVPKAVEAYKKMVNEDKVVAMFGWGTGDTEAMKGLIKDDKIPFISGSYAETLINPAETPYNFIVAPTYSQAARILLDYAKAKKADAKVALVYNDTAYGKSPLEDAKKYAAQIGLKWVGEVVVPLNASDATTQVLELQAKGAEFVLIQETTNATAVTLKSAQKQNLLGKIQFLGLQYSTDEGVIKAAGDAAEGFVGVPAFFFPYESGPGIQEALDYAKSKGKKPEDLNQKWIQGWSFGKIMVDAIARAGDNVTGESIKKALESFRDYDLKGLGGPLTFTDKDHGGAKKARIYQVKGGKWQMIQDFTAPQGK